MEVPGLTDGRCVDLVGTYSKDVVILISDVTELVSRLRSGHVERFVDLDSVANL